MTTERDQNGVPHHLVTVALAERLIEGQDLGPDVSAGAANVAALFRAARQPEGVSTSTQDAKAIAAFVEARRSLRSQSITGRTTGRRRGSITARVAVTAAAVVLATAGAAADAGGHLPDPILRKVSDLVAHVGVDVPRPEPTDTSAEPSRGAEPSVGPGDEATTAMPVRATAVTDGSAPGTGDTKPPVGTTVSTAAGSTVEGSPATPSTPVGPALDGPAKRGLCTAYLAAQAKDHSKKPDAVAFRNLLDAAATAGHTVEAFCADVVTSTTAPTNSPTNSPATATTAPATSVTTRVGNGNGNGNGHGPTGTGGPATTTAHGPGTNNGVGGGKP